MWLLATAYALSIPIEGRSGDWIHGRRCDAIALGCDADRQMIAPSANRQPISTMYRAYKEWQMSALRAWYNSVCVYLFIFFLRPNISHSAVL